VATAYDEDATQRIGGLSITSVNHTSTGGFTIDYTIHNTLRDVYGGKISIPVRLTVKIQNRTFNIVFLASNGDSNVEIKSDKSSGTIRVQINTGSHSADYPPYIYDYSGNVWVSGNYSFTIRIGHHTTSTHPTTSTHTMETSTGT
jgi:hypothetical protein